MNPLTFLLNKVKFKITPASDFKANLIKKDRINNPHETTYQSLSFPIQLIYLNIFYLVRF